MHRFVSNIKKVIESWQESDKTAQKVNKSRLQSGIEQPPEPIEFDESAKPSPKHPNLRKIFKVSGEDPSGHPKTNSTELVQNSTRRDRAYSIEAIAEQKSVSTIKKVRIGSRESVR